MFVFKISDRFAECGLLMQCLEELARKYPATKFVKIISTDCIPNYPDRNLPTVLVYNNGAVKANYVGLRSFGRRCTPEGILCMPVLAFTLYHYFYFKFICASLYNYNSNYFDVFLSSISVIDFFCRILIVKRLKD